jgi:hypothetical protein
LGLAAVNVLASITALVASLWAYSFVRLDSTFGILAAALAGQLTVAVRLWCRIASSASEAALWTSAGVRENKTERTAEIP